MKSQIEEIIDTLGITEEEAMRAILSAFGPSQPGAVSASWKRTKNYQSDVPIPTTREIWSLFEDADFRCRLCQSQLRITVDHVNSDCTDHSSENLQILCFECNRKKSKRGIQNQATNYRVYRSTVDLFSRTGQFPSNKEILKEAGLKKVNACLYLIKYLQKRLTGSCDSLREQKAIEKKSS